MRDLLVATIPSCAKKNSQSFVGCFPIMFLQQEKGEHFSQVSSFGLLLLIVALETPRVAITAAEDDLKLVPHFFP